MTNTNQHFPVPLAESPEPRLTREVRDLARRLAHNVADLSKQERQFLWDQMRRSAHRSDSLDRMAEIAERSPDPADGLMLGHFFLARARRRQRALAGVSIAAAEQLEADTEAECNRARVARLLSDTPTNRAREKDAALRELHAAERLVEALGL